MNDELEKLFGTKKMKISTLLARSFKYVKKEIWWILLAMLLILISVAIDIILPLITMKFVELLDEAHIMNTTINMVIGIALGYLGLAVFNQIVAYFEAMILQSSGQRIVYELRMDVFSHIEKMSQNQFNEMPVGSLVTRVASYTEAMSNLFTDTLVKLIRNILTIVAVFASMIVLSLKLSLFLLGFTLVAVVLSFVFGYLIGRAFRKERECLSDVNSFLSENLSGMKIIQVFNQERRKQKEFDEKNSKLRKAKYRVVLVFAFYRPLINLLYFGAIATTFGVGLQLALSGAEIVGFYLYLSRFFNPIQNISEQVYGIQRALTACERLYNLLDVKPEVLDKPEAIEIDHFEGKIEFKNVWFAYEKDNWILKDVSFVIKPKQTVAFVGATGAGKTTILSLIVRNFEIQKGQILIDDIDISKIKVESLRKAIGQMLQDVFLFSGSIKTNITLHDDDISNEEVAAACQYVNADKFIDKLPNKYEEQVIERGENFSSGQRQLLSFARCVVHKPQMLILDEATSNIDTETEAIIQNSLEKMKNIGTMLVVAHRLSTIQHADNIIVLQNGEIVEQGSHQKLLRNKAHYYKLYKLQFADK